MEVQRFDKLNRNELNRKVLNAYWVIFVISIIAEIATLALKTQVNPTQYLTFIFQVMIVPTGAQLIILGLNELLLYFKRDIAYIIIVSGTVIASVLLMANDEIHIQFLYLFPLLGALFYFDSKKLLVAFILNLTAFFGVYTLNDNFRSVTSIYELSAFIFMMISMLYIFWQLIHRGKQILNDLTKSMQSEQDLRVKNVVMDQMIKMDALTNLYNHKTFHEYLDLVLGQSGHSMPVQLAILDIDNFKRINDTYGHSVGDVILRKVADNLKDTLSSNEIIARYGGEEFTVIFPGKTLEEAHQDIEKARKSIFQLKHEEMNGSNMSVSIGLASYKPGTSKTSLFSEVDSLLYVAKRSGKNKTVIPDKTYTD